MALSLLYAPVKAEVPVAFSEHNRRQLRHTHADIPTSEHVDGICRRRWGILDHQAGQRSTGLGVCGAQYA